ncbi:hypothetical protein DY000_02013973 [Brassica cretica]|uniref:Uncharacterized protein n=1 Tax=Brassica cretica TaxID=69181 RepID=A0ABQ7D2W5_BRACR|nr:hypothetical protein DY000_02013973 [Brassica cretica]
MEAMTSVDFENSFIFPSLSSDHWSSSPSLLCINPYVVSKKFIKEIFKHHNIIVSSNGPIGIDECLVFGAYGFIKAPYGDYWKFMKKGITTNMLGPQAMERSRGMTLGRSFSEENNDVKVSELSLELGALTQKIFLQQVLRKELEKLEFSPF